MKKIGISIFIIGIILALSNCGPGDNKSIEPKKNQKTKTYEEGIAILGQNCISCHAPKKELATKIGPSLIAIKKEYLKEGINESEFVNNMTKFLLTPSIDLAKMPDAVEQFGLMPNMGMSKAQYEAVAAYLFRTEIEKPNWYEDDYQKEKAKLNTRQEEGTPDYLKKGMNIALSAKAVLGKNLLTAIQTNGTAKALEFCNEKAILLTDSIALELNTKIKRVSDKNRNIENSANERELEYIKQAKKEIKKHGKASPKLQEINEQIIAYYPIMTNNMCLQCHGNSKVDIDEKTLAMINKKYPEDKAIAYSINELRGIWVINMDK